MGVRACVAVGLFLALQGWGADMATIWEDDFESGNALSVSYDDIWEAETNATCGRGGGWGCRGTGSGTDPIYGEFYYYLPTPVEVAYLRATIDIDSAFYAGTSGEGGSILQLYDEDTWIVSLMRDDNRLYVDLAVPNQDYVIETGEGFLTPETWQTLQLEVWFSTGGGYLTYPNYDGRVKLTVDGVVIGDVTGLRLMTYHRYNTVGGPPNAFSYAYIIPGGNADNFGLYDAPPPTTAWVPVRDWVEQEIPSSAFPGGVARILGDLWSEDTGSPLPTIQARLYNLTDAVSVGESAALQSATYPSACDFSVTLTPGTKRYRAEVTSDPTAVDIFFSSRGVGP